MKAAATAQLTAAGAQRDQTNELFFILFPIDVYFPLCLVALYKYGECKHLFSIHLFRLDRVLSIDEIGAPQRMMLSFFGQPSLRSSSPLFFHLSTHTPAFYRETDRHSFNPRSVIVMIVSCASRAEINGCIITQQFPNE